jgi:hypothetical protein
MPPASLEDLLLLDVNLILVRGKKKTEKPIKSRKLEKKITEITEP